MLLGILIEEFFQNQAGDATRDFKKNVDIYYSLLGRELSAYEEEDVAGVLRKVLAEVKRSKKIKNPEYFFKFLALLNKKNRRDILEELTSEMFDKPVLQTKHKWVNDILKDFANEDIRQKLEELGIEPTVSVDFSSFGLPTTEKIAIDFSSVESKLNSVFDTKKEDNNEVLDVKVVTNPYFSASTFPQYRNASLLEAAVEDLGNEVIEDHLYFNDNGEQLPREKAPEKEIVDKIKNISRKGHASGELKNSFLEEEPRKIIVNSMKEANANTSAFVCAFVNPKKPTQKIVDCITFGEPLIRFCLKIRYGGGAIGVLYYYPYEKKLTIGDDKGGDAQIVNPELFPNIIISDPVRCKSAVDDFVIDDGTAQTKSRNENIGSDEHSSKNKSSTVTFDGARRSRSGVPVDFGGRQ